MFWNRKSKIKGIKFRKATFADAKAIAKLIAAEYGQDPKMYENRTLQDLKKPLERLVFVALLNNEIIGYGRAKKFNGTHYPFPGPQGWYLMGLLVAPKFRGRGIGGKLTTLRLNHISKIDHEIFYCTNNSNSFSIQLHKKLGFIEINRGPGFVSVDFQTEFQEDGILFKKIF